MAVKALTFDVFGTVVDWRSTIIEEFQAFGREKGIAANWEAFVDDWKSCYRPGMDAVREGRLPWTNVDGLYRKKLDALLGEYGISGLSEAEKTRLNRAWHRCKPWPDVVAGLTRLKTKYALSTLSNGDVACLVNMAKHGGLPWDCILCAEIFHHYKPDGEVYRGAIDLLGWEPEEIMMVAAHNYDLGTARSHGMRTAFVPRPLEYGPGQASDLKPEEDWDVVAGDFEELAAVLGA
ncbi:MAG: haloacid dehalogenase type II [Deltaproteobacteria bacterium]|nr:haloacid dehalogenase type II [Deltaproteobacteria bacterium]